MRIYRTNQAPYYRVDGTLASANAGDKQTTTPARQKLKKSEQEKKLSQDDEDSSIVIYA